MAQADGERLPLAVKDLGSCDMYPTWLSHSPNGRFVAVCGDGEYIIYTALAWRNKSYGSAVSFVWGDDSNVYATRESGSTVRLFKNFKEAGQIKPGFTVEEIYGGALLALRTNDYVCFYDWGTSNVRFFSMPYWVGRGTVLQLLSAGR
jgi:coatomer subunit beta'